jgi:Type I restriction enzyme R protein N terminus (HSDR_N)
MPANDPRNLSADKITLDDLQRYFGLDDRPDPSAFLEWQQDLPALTDNDRDRLDNYNHLSKRPILEAMVKMVILSPLLELAGFYDAPFYSTSEKSIKISTQDDHITVRGKIDVLVTQDQLWILVIESKQSGIAIDSGIPQALTYMLAAPNQTKPLYGMVTNGNNFIFIKLQNNAYQFSDEFSLRRRGDLYQVLAILKNLANILK